MSRTYDQYCPVARALEFVGERWTLLVARALLLGPRRFPDLMTGLPGISANVLAGRLKDLEEEGMVARRTLPPPAASALYDLTPPAAAPAVLALPPRGGRPRQRVGGHGRVGDDDARRAPLPRRGARRVDRARPRRHRSRPRRRRRNDVRAAPRRRGAPRPVPRRQPPAAPRTGRRPGRRPHRGCNGPGRPLG